MASSDQPLLPTTSPRSLADGPPSGSVPVAMSAVLATAGLAMLLIGGAGGIRPLTISGSLVSALALGAILYWRAALISYWQLVAIGSGDDPPPSAEVAPSEDAADASAEAAEPVDAAAQEAPAVAGDAPTGDAPA